MNWEFHAILYGASRMPRLMSTIRMLHNNVNRYLIIYLDRLAAQNASQEEHRAILKACREKDAASAIEHLTGHLNRASDRLTAFLR